VRDDAADRLGQRALAASGRPADQHELAVADTQRDVVQGKDIGQADGQAVDLDRVKRGGGSRLRQRSV